MYYVGLCPRCEEGLLGIRVCDSQANILCDECDALWTNPQHIDGVPFMVQADPPCPECGQSLWGKQAHWADRREVESVNWWSNVIGEAGDRSESGGPRTPDRIDPLADHSPPGSASSHDDPATGSDASVES